MDSRRPLYGPPSTAHHYPPPQQRQQQQQQQQHQQHHHQQQHLQQQHHHHQQQQQQQQHQPQQPPQPQQSQQPTPHFSQAHPPHHPHSQPPPPPPPPPQPQPPQQYHQQPLPPHTGAQQHPLPSHTPHPPPPPPPPPHHPQQQQQQHQQHPLSYSPANPPHPSQGPSLPPIHTTAYAPPASSSAESHNLPPFRAPPPHEQRDSGADYHHSQYNHNRSGHATPAPINRSYSHDSGPLRSPATPGGSGQYPPSNLGQEGPPPPPGQLQSHSQSQHPPPQSQLHMEHGQHGYPPTNGVAHGLPPPSQHHETHAPPMTPVDHYQYGPGQPQSMYNGGSYGPATGNMYGTKRKQMRATQACEQCRQRKQKCDEGSPCSFCKENNLSCQYRDTPPAKADKNMEKLLAHMEAQTAGLEELKEKMTSVEARLRQVEQTACRGMNNPMSGISPEPIIPDEPEPPKREPGIEDHRTAPHKLLLLWPSVRPLLKSAGVEHGDGYVMEAEDRGVLRLWTRGEGIDENDGTQPGGPASPARSDESGEGANAPTPHAEGLWGMGFPSTPNSETRRSEPYSAGGLNSNGEIDLDVSTINELYDSYMRHLHIMHPFLDKKRLRRMFDLFIRRYSYARPRAAFVAHGGNQRPLKRQRSNGSTVNVGAGSDTESRREHTERSPGNAIIYLVLALGKICLHKQPLPPIVPDSKLQVNSVISHQISANRGFTASSPANATMNMKPSPMSPKSTPTTQPTPPSDAAYRMHDSRSRRSSTDGSSGTSAGPRNLDIIPGIAYYAKAAEILGDQGDGNDLVHAQMFLLAGLYKGQLARVKESMSWYSMASRAIQTLLDRYKLYNKNYWSAFGDVRRAHERDQSRIKDTRQSLIVLASWTCLQLESDILAELRLPSSNIQSIESLLLMPHKVPEEESYASLESDGKGDEYNSNILLFYTAQLFLRRRLNEVHRQMYGPECLNQSLSEVQAVLSGHEHTVSKWRTDLPPLLQWDDDAGPATDILAARLRAKYWGARYVINRPFLDFALHILPHTKLDRHRSIESVAKDGHGNPRDKADIHLFKAIARFSESQIWLCAQQCIECAMQSTVAFDGVPDRLIVTNIHGTAHAQFGNMLVLSAAYQSNFLKKLIPTDKFQYLLERTISFLRKLAPISPTCAADCGILEKFNHVIFPSAHELPSVYKNEGVEPMSASTSFDASS